MKINQIIREQPQQDGCPPCPTAPSAKQRDGAINHPMVNKALTPHWLTNLIPGVNATQTVAKAARDLVNAISDQDPKALAAAVASAPGPLQAAAGTANQAMGAYDKIKTDGPSLLSKIQSYNPFRSRSGPPAPIEYKIAKPVPPQTVSETLDDTELKTLQYLAGIGSSARLQEYKGLQGSNISGTGNTKGELMKKHNIEPGTPEWFKLWFSLPYMTGEQPVGSKNK